MATVPHVPHFQIRAGRSRRGRRKRHYLEHACFNPALDHAAVVAAGGPNDRNGTFEELGLACHPSFDWHCTRTRTRSIRLRQLQAGQWRYARSSLEPRQSRVSKWDSSGTRDRLRASPTGSTMPRAQQRSSKHTMESEWGRRGTMAWTAGKNTVLGVALDEVRVPVQAFEVARRWVDPHVERVTPSNTCSAIAVSIRFILHSY